MLETNIRVVAPGTDLYIWTRLAQVAGTNITHDLVERACGRLRYAHKIAAISMTGEPPKLLIASHRPIHPIQLQDEEWELLVTDMATEPRKLNFADAEGSKLMPTLIERALLATLTTNRLFWNLDSPRMWYEEDPFCTDSDIAAYRRFEISALALDDVGIGVAVDVGTAFFSTQALDYFFNADVSDAEYRRRKTRFERLTNRQAGQKGTLLYDNGHSRIKCYFEDARSGVTCNTTGKVRARGRTYNSLTEYYREVYPNLSFQEEGPAVWVSFPGLEKPQPVAAERLRVRVMNDELPRRLRSIDKIAPGERRELLQNFWSHLGPHPFGWVAPGVQPDFWRPPVGRFHLLPIPELIFGKGQRLAAPVQATPSVYRTHFRQRAKFLEQYGCYAMPAVVDRTIYFVHPKTLDKAACVQMADDLTKDVKQKTTRLFSQEVLSYHTLSEAIEELREASKAGTVVFVLDHEPAAYYEVSFHLDGWRVKRVMETTLRQHYDYYCNGASRRSTDPLDVQYGRNRWRDFIEKNVFELLQLMDGVPYRLMQAGPYEAQLTIDVGHDRRYFALSLLLARPAVKSPEFVIASHVYTKPEHQSEAINHVILSHQLVSFLNSLLPAGSDPLTSILVSRDGQFCGREIEAVDNALAILRAENKLAQDAQVDLINVHKDSQKAVRIWQVEHEGQQEVISNPLEGFAVELNSHTVALTTTGAATLHQGTADPFLLIGNGRCQNLVGAAAASFAAAQLNWSSPSIAQRLPLPLKRTDEELAARAAQEVRRLR
jgi:hypothetical protein